jgi:hypothetical protein
LALEVNRVAHELAKLGQMIVGLGWLIPRLLSWWSPTRMVSTVPRSMDKITIHNHSKISP